MKILNIALKEIKHNLRNRKVMAIMTLFPIILIVILGAAFSSAMGGDSISLGEIKVLYTIEGKGNISEGFNQLTQGLGEFDVNFTETQDIEGAKTSIQDSNYSCFVLIDEKSKEVKLFKNERYNFEASFVEGILNTFIQRYNLINEVAKVNPKAIQEIVKETGSKYVTAESLDNKRQPRAVDYYGVTMTSLFILYAAMTAGFGMSSEKVQRTGDRMLVSPIRKEEIFIGKVLGFLAVTMIEIAIVVLFSKYVIKVEWGNNMGIILLILASEIIMAVSIGTALSFFTKSEAALNGVLNLVIPVIAFFAGAYVPLEQFKSKVILNIAKLSPLRWVNDAVTNVIYLDSFKKVIPAIAINLSIAIILLVASSILFTRREV